MQSPRMTCAEIAECESIFRDCKVLFDHEEACRKAHEGALQVARQLVDWHAREEREAKVRLELVLLRWQYESEVRRMKDSIDSDGL